ncbi:MULTISPECIES: Rieske 2Fe-2S domain-containing protein [Pseudonocardia]|uniref:3-phenylpropionate/trans-cinnamate dioxygenase ferredoxin subunit n=1 Tax=Pseudonocardia oroxyli TaxID=366584 RepID=A0A1G7G398_PSEOR|nr:MULTISPECIES: Rieske 2Fe-2S domain-containing protein [Pseudonocardia]MCF7552977.1 Rieske 2Fe-2S domain-containing protein [Pseudonocardia sp. WMMC193]SDE82583.1 3-phenylpropionate/trans-cinnamate dioxygenase ferredoxin subunit [Pseudonocardia oroxyli]
MEFHKIARSGQIPDGVVRRFFAGDVEVALSRQDGEIHATSNYCSHLDCLLSSGKVTDEGLLCSCHGSVFDYASGEPLCPPATRPIVIFPVREEDGHIHVGIDEELAAAAAKRRASGARRLTPG